VKRINAVFGCQFSVGSAHPDITQSEKWINLGASCKCLQIPVILRELATEESKPFAALRVTDTAFCKNLLDHFFIPSPLRERVGG
jgi:hypothetical protein